jgi:hypothetical protein
VAETPKIWWVKPAVAAGILAAIVLPILNVRLGSTPAPLAAGAAVADLIIFLGTFSIFRRMKPKEDQNSLSALVASLVISLPVFIIAFFGLGYEITVLADIGAMYVAGVWIGSAEATEKDAAE